MKEVMYTLGMICRAIWPESIGDVPPSILKMLPQPVSMLAFMVKHSDTEKKQRLVADLVDRLPADLRNPAGGVKNEDQSSFWLGYYHLDTAVGAAKQCTPEDLKKAGEALFGERWQTDLSRELGLSDARRIRQWMAGERPIPVGIWADVCQLLRRRQITIQSVLTSLQKDTSSSQ